MAYLARVRQQYAFRAMWFQMFHKPRGPLCQTLTLNFAKWLLGRDGTVRSLLGAGRLARNRAFPLNLMIVSFISQQQHSLQQLDEWK